MSNLNKAIDRGIEFIKDSSGNKTSFYSLGDALINLLESMKEKEEGK